MDRVRFGRALGYGARHAVKTLAQAMDAATAQSEQTTKPTTQPQTPRPTSDLRQDIAEAGRTVLQAHQAANAAKAHVRGAAKVAGKSALAPVKRFSSVLWLEVTGSFFALVAMAMGSAVWKLRGAMRFAAMSPERLKLYGCLALALLFAYFAVSNFVRAARRQRQ